MKTQTYRLEKKIFANHIPDKICVEEYTDKFQNTRKQTNKQVKISQLQNRGKMHIHFTEDDKTNEKMF